jgi:UDP-glucose:(heptosyl)LPS alpha-1,3-glucosyltransferase
MRELERRQYASRRGIFIAVSQMVQNHMQHYYKVEPNRQRLVYNGIANNLFSKEDRTVHRIQIRKKLGLGEEVLFLFAGHNPRLKGIRTALKAIALLKRDHPRIHLAAIGRGEVEIYKNMVKQWGIKEQVTFCGFVDDSRPYYMAADVLVHPTFYDACSLVVMEAWASGLPVITTQFNGAAELMIPGRQGVLLEDPKNADELAHQMKLLLDASLRLKMGEEARSLGSACSMENNFKEIEKIYKEIS